ncbi:unnamed protein product [Pedinophyceae sp. YPF-701]|nr:unnamed protein product [Pedinophyceae sp. YPF-701]
MGDQEIKVGIGIFARHPTPGRVKTRLARSVGDEAAADFYRACAEHVIAQVVGCARHGCPVTVFCSRADEQAAVTKWVRGAVKAAHVDVRPQSTTADLGDRMLAAMQDMVNAGCGAAIIVGTDVPDLTTEIVLASAAALRADAEGHGAVLGPADDGGYYLVGSRAPIRREMFSGVPWSRANTRAATLRAFAAAGLRTAPEDALPRLRDIDTFEDLQTWLEERSEGDPHPLSDVATTTVARGVALMDVHGPV